MAARLVACAVRASRPILRQSYRSGQGVWQCSATGWAGQTARPRPYAVPVHRSFATATENVDPNVEWNELKEAKEEELRKRITEMGDKEETLQWLEAGLRHTYEMQKPTNLPFLMRERIRVAEAVGKSAPEVLNLHRSLAMYLINVGKAKEAEPVTARALGLARELMKRDSEVGPKYQLAAALMLHARCLYAKEEPDAKQAVETAAEAVALGEQHLPDDAEMLFDLNNELCAALVAGKRFTEAIPILQSLAEQSKSDETTFGLLNAQVFAQYFTDAKEEQVQPTVSRMFQLGSELAQSGMPQVYDSLKMLGINLRAGGKLEASVGILEATHGLLLLHEAVGDASTLSVIAQWAESSMLWKGQEEALRILDASWKVWQPVGGSEDLTKKLLDMRVLAAGGLDDKQACHAALLNILDQAKAAYGETSSPLAHCHTAVAVNAVSTGNTETALAALEDAVAIAKENNLEALESIQQFRDNVLEARKKDE